jgi:hypothetical protein
MTEIDLDAVRKVLRQYDDFPAGMQHMTSELNRRGRLRDQLATHAPALLAEVERLTAERDELARLFDELTHGEVARLTADLARSRAANQTIAEQHQAALADVARMAPVVEAAVAWNACGPDATERETAKSEVALAAAVDAYTAAASSPTTEPSSAGSVELSGASGPVPAEPDPSASHDFVTTPDEATLAVYNVVLSGPLPAADPRRPRLTDVLVDHPQDQLGTGGLVAYPDEQAARAAAGTAAKVYRLVEVDDLKPLLGSIDNALRNGSYMTNANLAFAVLCDRLSVFRDGLAFEPNWPDRVLGPLTDATGEAS